MRYFRIKGDKAFTDLPVIKNWFTNYTTQAIPDQSLVRVENKTTTCYADFIFFPTLMLSEAAKAIIAEYEPLLEYKELIMLAGEDMHLYYLPELPAITCLDAAKSVLTYDKNDVTKPVLRKVPIGDSSIFRLAGLKNNIVIMRCDLVESLLRRYLTGMALEIVEIEE